MKDPTLDELIERFKGWEGPEVSGEVVYKMNTTDKLAKALRKLQARLDPYDYPDEQEAARKALAAYDAELAATPATPEAQQAGEQALPPYTSERHFALREAHCIKDGDDYYAARSHLGENVQRRATFDAGYVRGFDRATELVSARAALAATPAAPQDERVPLTPKQVAEVCGLRTDIAPADFYLEFARAIERAHGIGQGEESSK